MSSPAPSSPASAADAPSNLEFVPVTTPEQLATVAALAHAIWYEFYVPLIGRAQVDYMVARFQSAPAMQAQIEQGYEYFLVRREDARALDTGFGADIGYCAVQEQPGRVMFLSKFYLHHAARGSGTGRRCMEFIEGLARRRGLSLLWLTVNKGNPSVQAYQRLGFRIAAELVMDIGGGFVMDDYRMEKALQAP
ncbi:GNAT family N-acetyltransferase [Steroidobacter sp. S1-65]|uniref:GNAT family N-acetyltransferase n=1 Tax=Steroidobacter gossypii TaxID=2805490 RepID=A0ABS1WR94_9GAMM|nr:GNAT family N-acetyltransferase [Steroidobacter gossypii]MBM0103488.1 GNAT family N-acetyltransferase [Steroidobacter gossypii]